MAGLIDKPTHRIALGASALLIVSLATGAIASDPATLRFHDMDGQAHDADAMLATGRPVVFVFWQTWCPSCKKEAPELAHAVERYGDRIAFFGVISGPDEDVDDKDVRETANDWGHLQPQIRDRDLALATRFDVTGTPLIVVLGTEARVLYRGYRLPDDWDAFLPAAPATPEGQVAQPQ
ncbi:MAG: TlpA disulfide reductase family protein [Myxococcota bacterium]|nr:TlpA disulfide reductase family protein [Myxococcota bacterium]